MHFRRSARVAATAAVLALLPVAALAQYAAFEGRWYGTGREHPVRPGIQTEYPVQVTMTGDNGQIDYPASGCGGTLIRIAGDATLVRLREHITYGTCLDGGEVTLNTVGSALSFTWLGRDDEGTFIVLTAMLYRQ